MLGATRARVGENNDVRLISDLIFRQHRFAIVAAIPDGNEKEIHLWIFLHHFRPATALEFRLAIATPRRPEMDHGDARRLDGGGDALLRGIWRRRKNGRERHEEPEQREEDGFHSKGQRRSITEKRFCLKLESRL